MPRWLRIYKVRVRAFILTASALVVALALPVSVLAANDTQLGLRVTNSSQFQGATGPSTGQPGGIQLGIRVTDSAHPVPLTLQVTYNTNGGSDVPAETVRYNQQATEPANPERDGYRFLGWYTQPSGGARYDFSTPVKQDLELYAQWTMTIEFAVPTAATVTVDAAGTITGDNVSFVSSTVAPLKVSAVMSEQLEGAAALFPEQAVRADVKTVLTPLAGTGAEVQVPLASANGVAANFLIPQRQGLQQGEFAVKFALSLPPDARLAYLPSEVEVAKLTYTIGLASS